MVESTKMRRVGSAETDACNALLNDNDGSLLDEAVARPIPPHSVLMPCASGRPHLSDKLQLLLFSEAAGYCQRCGTWLFANLADKYFLIAEMAHIVAASPEGPRGADREGVDVHSIDNIVLLCPTCHTLVDKAPDEFPADLLRRWKSDRKQILQERIGVPRYGSRPEARRGVQALLDANYLVFTTYGPDSEAAHTTRDEAAEHWRRKVREVILPNNRRLLAISDVNADLLTSEEQKVVEVLRQHVDDLEARHLHALVEPNGVRFPAAFANVFAS